MRMDQWKTASTQLLKHWSKSGITQLPAGTSQSVATACEWLETNATSIYIQDDSADGPRLATLRDDEGPIEVGLELHQPNQANLKATPTPAKALPAASKAIPANLESLPQGLVKWNLPVLNIQDRQGAFASLDQEVIACRKCEEIVCRRQQTVFGVGAINARVVMFGEAPGADEDRLGEPFVGAAGQLLDKILVASGLKRPEVYIVNALKCRPPNNRTPTETEIENCRPFFERQLETIQPEYIVCWGAVAVRAVLGSTESIGRLRGKFHHFRGAKVMVTYHPAYLLRTPDAKKLTWEDMKMLMKDMGLPLPSTG